MNTGKLAIGSFCLARNKKDGGGYESRWLVQFKLPGADRKRESSKLPICGKCLKDEKALQDRVKCECQKEARSWAAVRLDEMALKWKGGRLEKSEKKVKALTLGDVKKIYEVRGPEERKDNLRALAFVVGVPLGRHGEEVWKTTLDELVPDLWDEFAWCYQEYERQGMTERAEAEDEDAPRKERMAAVWMKIRKQMPEHPDPDRETATTGNTTIISQMRKAKSVLGPESRDSYLKPIRDSFPDSLLKWWGTKINITTADNRFSLPPAVYAKMWHELPALKQVDPQAWALIRLHWTTGIRPVEAQSANVKWLEQDEDGAVLLVVKNRPEDGFKLKDRTTKQQRPWPMPADLVEVLPKIVSEDGNLLGCDTPGQWDRVYRRASAWLREMGVEGSQTLYNLRKLVGTVKRANEGGEAMAGALGHSNVKTGDAFYAGTSQAIKALTDAELSPEAVMGLQRKPWKMPEAA